MQPTFWICEGCPFSLRFLLGKIVIMSTEQFTDVLKQLAEYKDYFVSKESVNDLVGWLHEETSINKASLNLTIKWN